jgi:glycosyltransferase involved in cell wall biosynthesis
MESNPLVSVVIPSYNDARFVRQAIGSVLAQTHRALDVIVVDDGSTDGTADIALEFGSPVRVFRQANAGAAVARNRGLDEARGEYVAFLDADDFWHPRKTEVQLRHLRTCGQCVAIYCNKIELRADMAEPSWHEAGQHDCLDALSPDPRSSGWLYLELLRASVLHTSTVMASRETLEKVGRFDVALRKGQDLDYWLRLSRLGPIHMLDSVLSAYRIHRASISHRAMGTNYHAHVVERAAGRFGPSDPSGQSLAHGELARILAASWFEFAYQHFRAGAPLLCLQSLQRSRDYRPYRVGAWLLAARAAFKALWISDDIAQVKTIEEIN